MKYPNIILNSRGLKKFLKGALWFTKEDISSKQTCLSIEPGEVVSIYSEDGYFLAQGYFNPKVFFALKILCKEKIEINEEFFFKSFYNALKVRKDFLIYENSFRLIHGEGDYIPGLIIDIYCDLAVIQIYTLGMEKLKSFIYSALKKLIPLKYIVFKNNFDKRKEENLPSYIEFLPKEPEDPYLITIDEIKFLIPIKEGQKTGFFLDQRENRQILKNITKDKIVIDAFSYIGAFSMYALKGGAKKVYLIDRSSKALDLAVEIAKLNNFLDRVLPIEGEASKILREMKGEGDILILDPPAFIKSRSDIEKGRQKYRELYSTGINFFKERGGHLFLFSCSYFLKLEDLKVMIKTLLGKRRQGAKVIKILSQAKDHPINPFVEESEYLKGLWLYLEGLESLFQ